MTELRPVGPRVRNNLVILLLALLALPAAFLLARPAAAALNCDRASCGPVLEGGVGNNHIVCFFPASPVTQELWGELQPADSGTLPPERDTTAFNEFGNDITRLYYRNNWFMGVDVENGWVLAGLAHGIGIWDARTNPANPTFIVAKKYDPSPIGGFPFIPGGELSKFVFGAIDAPDDTIAAVVGYNGAGILVFDLTDKSQPKPVYQNADKTSESVYATTLGGTRYAFMAATAPSSGLYYYDLDRARTFSNGCLQDDLNPSACPGVLKGSIPTAVGGPSVVHGAGNFLAVVGGGKVQILDVSNPAAPASKLIANIGAAGGVALWNAGGSYFLGARISGAQTAIYNVSCVTSSSCSGGGTQAVSLTPLSTKTTDTQSVVQYLTFSRSAGGTPFLYVGGDAPCVADTLQHEWLFDVSNPSAPHDVTPQGTIQRTALYDGIPTTKPVSYWTWYYRKSPTGFDYVSPRAGKFVGDYFFRAAKSIFDIHKLAVASPPVADFSWSPSEVYPGTPVTFSDHSSGTPNQWLWSFPDGTPPTSSAQNPLVTFSSTGIKSVTLTAGNGLGLGNPTSQNVNVLDPVPVIGAISASPASPTVCQPVTLTATGVTGKPTLGYDWKIDSVHLSNATSPVWDTTSVTPGLHAVSLDVTNSSGTANKSINVNVAALSPLPGNGAFMPSNDIFTDGTVHFHVAASGATEWSWDFGDGFGSFTNDPINGPNPTHVYTTIGSKTVKVRVRNCLTAPGFVESAPLTIIILQTTPLVAGFSSGLFCQFGSCFATVNVPVPFTDLSTGAEIWEYNWDNTSPTACTTFPDGNHTTPVLTHTYAAAGDFYPCLRVKRGTETSSPAIHAKINVASGGGGGGGGGTSIAVGGPGSGVINTGYTFSATASGCTASASGWTWNTGGGSGSSTTSSITVTWSTAGGKTVTATNSACGSAQGTKPVTITDPGGGGGGGGGALQALFSFSPASPKPGDTVSFDASAATGSPTEYRWEFGDGATASGKNATHVYATAGSYVAKLIVSKPSTGCPFAPCVADATTTKTVVVQGAPPPPPVSAEFTANVECINVGGFDQCQAQTGQAVSLTATEADATSYSWSFDDGATGTGRSVSHAWAQPRSYAVSLTVVKGSSTASKTRTFIVSGDAVVTAKSVVLPWIAQTRGALKQSSDLYVHNPGTAAMDVTLEFRKRGVPETNPPRVTRTIQSGATLYVADVLLELFNRENVAGFISLKVDHGEVEPVITSFNTTFQTDGKQFGQTVAGVPMSTASAASSGPDVHHLVGLIDNSERLAYFGISNPSDEPAVYHLRFFDKTGQQIGESSSDLTLSRFGQRQFQVAEIHDTFGISNEADYRIEIEKKSGGQIVPYASNLRLSSEDPSFIESATTPSGKVYLVGALSTPGLNNSLWQTDMLLSNIGTQSEAADVTFTSVGPNSNPTAPLHVTLAPGKTERLEDVIAGQWGIRNAIGVVTITSTGASGFPVVQGESYENTNPAKRFGQSMTAVSDADAANAGQAQFLVGLRQDAKNRTTFWIFNPGGSTAEYDIVYRKLDGTALGTVSGVRLGAGKMRQFSPGQHLLPAAGAENGFTVQIKVKSGKVLSAAQVVNNLTNDPAYIQGEVR